MPKYKIFISYRRADCTTISNWLYDKLISRFGADAVFIDKEAIPPGTDFRAFIKSVLKDCEIMLVVIGHQWLEITDEAGRRKLDLPDDLTRIEIEEALKREMLVVPLLVDGTSLPTLQRLPVSIRSMLKHNAATIQSDYASFCQSIKSIIDRAEIHLDQKIQARQRVLNGITNFSPVEPLRKPGEHVTQLVPCTFPTRAKTKVGLKQVDWVTVTPADVTLSMAIQRSTGRLQTKRHHVTAFRMASYLFTNAEYQFFVEAKDGYANAEWWNFSPEAMIWRKAHPHAAPPLNNDPTHPRTNVSWYEAMACCRWVSTRIKQVVTLPFEAQWQRAAQGDDQREYPNGNKFYKDRANTLESKLGATTPVTAHPMGVSYFKIHDMGGNAQQWCINPYAIPDYMGLKEQGPRAVRGGAWKLNHAPLAERYSVLPETRSEFIGFRLIAAL